MLCGHSRLLQVANHSSVAKMVVVPSWREIHSIADLFGGGLGAMVGRAWRCVSGQEEFSVCFLALDAPWGQQADLRARC